MCEKLLTYWRKLLYLITIIETVGQDYSIFAARRFRDIGWYRKRRAKDTGHG